VDLHDAFIWKLSEDGPSNTVPGPQTAVKDIPRIFSTANGNRISVAGQEAGSGLGITLSAVHGTLTLAGTAGLTFTSGDGSSDAQMTFTGRAAAVNAALDGLRFLPDAGYTGPAEVEVRSFLASQSGPLKVDTDTVPITVQASACTPRPQVKLQTAPGGGRLLVTVTPTPLNGGTANAISELRFGAFANARVTLNGQPMSSGQTVALPPNTSQVSLSVERATPGQSTTVPFTVVDGCGSWQTFVGGGTGAGF
jgi:acyl dehydratase